MKSTDDEKWYKQRWPWLLIAMPATAVVAGAITAWIAVKSNDGLVADDYYKQGLGINQMLAKTEKAGKMGLHAQVKFHTDMVEISVKSSQDVALPETLVVKLVHPTQSTLDKNLLVKRSNDLYSAKTDQMVAGRWGVIIEDEARSWRLNGSIHFPTQTDIQISSVDLKPVD